GDGEWGRRLGRRGGGCPGDAKQRRGKLHQHAVARQGVRFPAADDRHHAWRVGRSQSLAGADGPDRSRRPAARGRDRLRSDRAGSGGPGRGGSRAHRLQWQPDRRGPALAAHARRQAFQGLNRWTNKARYGAPAPSPEYWPIAAIRSSRPVSARRPMTARLRAIIRSIFISGARWGARSRWDWDWLWRSRNAASWSSPATAKC